MRDRKNTPINSCIVRPMQVLQASGSLEEGDSPAAAWWQLAANIKEDDEDFQILEQKIVKPKLIFARQAQGTIL